jgi:hypothetical protein
MYIIRNAFRNLRRNKARNINLSIITFAIITATALALIINNAAGKVIYNYKTQILSEVKLLPNYEYDPADIPPISNEMFLSFSNSELVQGYNENHLTFLLKDPDTVDSFTAELRQKGLPNSYVATVDDVGYIKMVGPVEGLRHITFSFMAIVLILGAIILLFTSSLAIRERKY